MKVVYCEQGMSAVIANIKNDISNFRILVGGPIEVCRPFAHGTCLICNEEAMYKDIPVNRTIPAEDCPGQDYEIRGTFFICKTGGGPEDEFYGLTDEEAEMYRSRINALMSVREGGCR